MIIIILLHKKEYLEHIYNTQFGSVAAATNTWTHLALVRDSGKATLYVNGVADLSETNDPKALAVTDRFALAAQPQTLTVERFTGLLDEVRVFSVAPGTFTTNDLLFVSPVVTTSADAGAGSLRATLANAPSGATLTFAPNLSGQTITLTSGQISLGKMSPLTARRCPAASLSPAIMPRASSSITLG